MAPSEGEGAKGPPPELERHPAISDAVVSRLAAAPRPVGGPRRAIWASAQMAAHLGGTTGLGA